MAFLSLAFAGVQVPLSPPVHRLLQVGTGPERRSILTS